MTSHCIIHAFQRRGLFTLIAFILVALFLFAGCTTPPYLEHKKIGISLFKEGDYAGAEREFREAVNLKPDDAESYYKLGEALEKQGKYEEAMPVFQKAIELNPALRGARKVELRKQKRVEEAQRAIELNPADPKAYNELGRALTRQGHTEEAITAYRKAIELNPTYAEAFNNLGVALGEQKKTKAEITAYRKAIKLKPDFTVAIENLAMALDGQGKRKEARVYWLRAVKSEKRQERMKLIQQRLAEPD